MTSCDLCGLPAGRHPLERRFDLATRVFCCLGCLNVYSILAESGVLEQGIDLRDTELFRESLRLGLISTGQEAAKPPIPDGAETREAVFHVSGMWCSSCGWLIEHALAKERGVVSAEVMFASDLVKVKYCPQYVPPQRIPERIASLGYRASEFAAGETDRNDRDHRDLLLRIGVAFFLWMNVMLLSLVIYASYWEAISPTAQWLVPFVLMALTTPALCYSAWPILRAAALGLRNGTLRMEALLALGIAAAYGYSTTQAILGGKHYYFDTACAIIALVLCGKLLERGAKERTARAITLLYGMMPKKARMIADGREHFVAVEALEPGSIFLVKTGERIPADGVVMCGESDLDESVLTGESSLRHTQPGDEVIGGSLNTSGVLEIQATRVGSGSTLSQIIRSVEAAMSSRCNIERLVDRIARVFVPVVIAIAAAAFVLCTATGVPAGEALMRTIAVLVIACPCALGMATPLALTTAVGSLSRRGILVSDNRVLETVRKVDVVVLDKTGTVTEGRFSVLDAVDELAAIASLEVYSEHPLGRAIAAHACEKGLSLEPAEDVEIHQGLGISGRVDGVAVAAGNRRFMEGRRMDPDVEAQAREWESRGWTVTFVAAGDDVTGGLALGDRVRPEAPRLVTDLRRRGVETLLLSGDAPATTAVIAAAIGVDGYRAGVLPAEKLEVIRELQAAGKTVAMIGDGVNDAPALAAADLGIALGSGTDLAIQAAPVVLMMPSLDRALEVFDASRATLRVVRQNLFWAFFYNVAGITLAITGLLTPIFAAGAMILSSLSVIGNSMRLGSQLADGRRAD
jgi:heavy metal translocating P-type ATPase